MAHRRHLPLIPLDEARAALLAAATPLVTREVVPVTEALGRVAAERVLARESVPHYHGAAMDGIAVRAADVADASAAHPVHLELGSPASVPRPFSYVETGNALPAWADAVVMVERVFVGRVAGEDGNAPAVSPVAHAHPPSAAADDCCAPEAAPAPSGIVAPGVVADAAPPLEGNGARLVHVRAAAPPWQHVRLVGEDVAASDSLLSRGQQIRPYDVGALLAAGIVEIAVRPRPVVAILPTGDELIEPGAPRRPGRIVEFNSRMIAAFVREWGGEPVRLAPAGDNLDVIRSRIALALRAADAVCVIAGSSAGEHDFTALALASLGRILAHGIAVMPGKPAIVAAIEPRADAAGLLPRARIALGIPGYPVSAAVICRELLEPLLARLLGKPALQHPTIRAITSRRLTSRLGQEELLRVVVGRVGERTLVMPLARGAGAITTLARADGVLRLAPQIEAIEAGTEVAVELLRPLAEVRGTILVAGSHDPVLGVLEDALRTTAPVHKLATSSVGSWAGLLALARAEVHVATTASADFAPPDDDATRAAARALAALHDARGIVVIHLVARAVGLVVAPGNPLGLRSVTDLLRADVRTPPEVERSAVRMLGRVGAALSRAGAPLAGVSEAAIEEQELAPIAVAIAVQSGLADAGLCSASAAAALGLGFVPVTHEDYDLVLTREVVASPLGEALVAAVRSAAFRAAVAQLTGYDATRSGREKPLADGPLARISGRAPTA